MKQQSPSPRSTVHRSPKRAHYDLDLIRSILADALYCIVSFATEEGPFAIPMACTLHDDELLLHMATSSRMAQMLRAGQYVSVCVMHLDGVVLSRSAFHHSLNYRSVVLFAAAREVIGEQDKRTSMLALIDGLVAGRSAVVRAPNAIELQATAVFALPIHESSAKIRLGPPKEDEADRSIDSWCGVIPLVQTVMTPVPHPWSEGAQVPEEVSSWRPKVSSTTIARERVRDGA